MGEPTMEEYMTKTREDGLCLLIDANEHIEKVLEIVDLFHIPEVTQDQIMLRVFPISLTGVANRWLRNEPVASIITRETLKKKFLSKYCPPAQTAKKMEEINNFQQEPDETHYQAWERFKELLLRCPQHYLTDMQEKSKSLIKDLEIQIGQISKVLQEKGSKSLPNSTKINPRDHVKSISTTVEADTSSIRRIEHTEQYANFQAKSIDYLFPSRLIDDSYEEKEVLGELIYRRESAINLKRLLREKPRMGYQIEASMNMLDSTILKDSLPPKEKDPGVLLYLVILIIFVLKKP
ncbi:hypothetical protein Tco_1046548 [Tanacetum coccineum]